MQTVHEEGLDFPEKECFGYDTKLFERFNFWSSGENGVHFCYQGSQIHFDLG